MYGQGPWLSSLVWLAVPEQTKHMTDMDNKCTCSLVATKILLLCTDPIPLLFLLKICLSLKEPFLQASVVWWATFRVCMRSTLMIFAISICAHAHAWWAHGQRIWTRHTRTHTYIHKYSDFLVCVGLAPIMLRNQWKQLMWTIHTYCMQCNPCRLHTQETTKMHQKSQKWPKIIQSTKQKHKNLKVGYLSAKKLFCPQQQT